jgi:hypothetical protein
LTIIVKGVSNIKRAEEFLADIRKRRLILTEIDEKNDKCTLIYLVEGTKEELNTKIKKLYEKDLCELIKVE